MNYLGGSGKTYELAEKLAQGGEGEIHRIVGEPGLVAKLYKQGKATQEKERKLLKMAASPPNQSTLSAIAWPKDVLYQTGLFAGYIMPEMQIHEDLNVIYEYGNAAKYGHLTWDNKITIAMNLCAVFDSVHSAGYTCGDFHPRNIGVNPGNGLVSFLDTDSYHVQDGSQVYRCEVGSPEYLPAEIQQKMRAGSSLTTASLPTFTQYTDNFTLAVHIFQLLMNGAHPFMSRVNPGPISVPAPQPVENIAHGHFIFMMSVPGVAIPLYAPPISILPQTLQELFRRAFLDGHASPHVRPDPYEWHLNLRSLRNELKNCIRIAYHQYYHALRACPWCETDARFEHAMRPPLKQVEY